MTDLAMDMVPHRDRLAAVPDWTILLVLGVPWGYFGWRCLKRRSLTNRALCFSCGYDLRATPERCPECGHVPEMKTAEATS